MVANYRLGVSAMRGRIVGPFVLPALRASTLYRSNRYVRQQSERVVFDVHRGAARWLLEHAHGRHHGSARGIAPTRESGIGARSAGDRRPDLRVHGEP